MPRKQDASSPRSVTDADVDPRYRWDRPLQAPGHTQVDFEARVDFRRLHAYRLGRARQALRQSGLGALVMFDQYNIRYLSGTVIGEWARDKLTRGCRLAGAWRRTHGGGVASLARERAAGGGGLRPPPPAIIVSTRRRSRPDSPWP